ncbi:unnamed protein product [Phytophthora fragariaefolia]|uniref:Nonsense-mediated mRNA decay factor SMG8 n=1 Tax=Phytophthora fragariaefolia TaxID=1490495 RepID=A0A9W6YHU2_9STRA|nr:unnamed protein product [Phytophthora fragariaefolia]
MAFVQSLGAEKQESNTPPVVGEMKASPTKNADEIYEPDEDMFEDSGDEQTPPQKTLLEVAQQKAVSPSSLMDVAKSFEVEVAQQHHNGPKPTLAAIAAEINQEDYSRQIDMAQADKMQRALDAASSETRAERVAERKVQIEPVLKTVVADQQQQYEEEEFEDDAASIRMAAETLAASVAKARSVGHRSPNRGRSKLLKKGPTSSQSMSKLELQRAMQDKLSAFQFQQLSITQRRLFLASLAQADSTNSSRLKKRVANREALNELAKDKFTRARQKQKPRNEFARLDDNRHCRFTPRLHNSSNKKKMSNNDSDDDEGPGGSRGAALRRNEDFVRRMEAAERARREQLRRTREEAAYLARVDKKECPSCGNPQSYSELTQKRKKCPNCGVTYKSRIAWPSPLLRFVYCHTIHGSVVMAGGRGGGRQSVHSLASTSRHAPPLPFDRSQNEPVRVYPPEPGRSGSLAALQSLQNKSVAVVGLLSSSSSSSSQAFAFFNRLIGRCVFRDDEMQAATTVKDARLPASIHLYYDDVARCIYLLGVARPESLCFCPPAASKTATPNSNYKSKSPGRRQSMSNDTEDEEQTPLSEMQRIRHEMDIFEREKLKMQVLLYSSCNLLVVLREDGRVTTNVLKDIRTLAAEKAQLLSFAPTSTKHSKHSKGAPSSGGGNAFAPGRCVPLALYVVPAPDEVLDASLLKTQGSGPSRSATVVYCKSIEARMTTLFRSLRGSTVGSVRMRDALSATNLSKERRVFNIDPAHNVVVVSRRTATAEGLAEFQLESLLDALDSDTTADDILSDDSLLQPLEDDDMGFQRLNQYLHKYLDLLFSFVPSGSKDGGRTELLSPPQWVKAFNGLVKSYSRLDAKRRQEAAALEAVDSDSVGDFTVSASQATYQFDPMELSRMSHLASQDVHHILFNRKKHGRRAARLLARDISQADPHPPAAPRHVPPLALRLAHASGAPRTRLRRQIRPQPPASALTLTLFLPPQPRVDPQASSYWEEDTTSSREIARAMEEAEASDVEPEDEGKKKNSALAAALAGDEHSSRRLSIPTLSSQLSALLGPDGMALEDVEGLRVEDMGSSPLNAQLSPAGLISIAAADIDEAATNNSQNVPPVNGELDLAFIRSLRQASTDADSSEVGPRSPSQYVKMTNSCVRFTQSEESSGVLIFEPYLQYSSVVNAALSQLLGSLPSANTPASEGPSVDAETVESENKLFSLVRRHLKILGSTSSSSDDTVDDAAEGQSKLRFLSLLRRINELRSQQVDVRLRVVTL